ncbi:hypothetical protein Bbelb_111070 [Branchiostoma belcheri]|nr:hypothetical protein Bbelb_111070 [Branchiostoma belcheri]
MKHLESAGLLADSQYGFRSGRSTADLLTVISEKVYRALNACGESRLVALDISKAFDKVWHAGLIRKLEAYGIRGPMANILSSFLSETKLKVVLDGPGSILDKTEMAAGLENDLRSVVEWGDNWLVTFNAQKTKLLSINRYREPFLPPISMNGNELRENESPSPRSYSLQGFVLEILHRIHSQISSYENTFTVDAQEDLHFLFLHSEPFSVPQGSLPVLINTPFFQHGYHEDDSGDVTNPAHVVVSSVAVLLLAPQLEEKTGSTTRHVVTRSPINRSRRKDVRIGQQGGLYTAGTLTNSYDY